MEFKNTTIVTLQDCTKLREALTVILEESKFKIPYSKYTDNEVALALAKRLFSIEAEAKKALEDIQQFIVEGDAMSLKDKYNT